MEKIEEYLTIYEDYKNKQYTFGNYSNFRDIIEDIRAGKIFVFPYKNTLPLFIVYIVLAVLTFIGTLVAWIVTNFPFNYLMPVVGAFVAIIFIILALKQLFTFLAEKRLIVGPFGLEESDNKESLGFPWFRLKDLMIYEQPDEMSKSGTAVEIITKGAVRYEIDFNDYRGKEFDSLGITRRKGFIPQYIAKLSFLTFVGIENVIKALQDEMPYPRVMIFQGPYDRTNHATIKLLESMQSTNKFGRKKKDVEYVFSVVETILAQTKYIQLHLTPDGLIFRKPLLKRRRKVEEQPDDVVLWEDVINLIVINITQQCIGYREELYDQIYLVELHVRDMDEPFCIIKCKLFKEGSSYRF